MHGRNDETLPLAASISTRINSDSNSARNYILSTRAKRIGATCLGLLALAVTANLLFSRSTTPSFVEPPPPAAIVRPTNTVLNAAAASSSSSSSFPGAADEIVDTIAKPTSYTSKLYSGYLTLANGGEVFYYLAESQSDDATDDPVLLWLNGGPGASSLAGCFTENGPLLVTPDGNSVVVNPHAWNQNAHLLCIESPVGVGFSYNASSVYTSNDAAQAADLYDALQQFYVKFPYLRPNEFILSGESYGGVYVPTTALAIVHGNKLGNARINLTKFVVGNGVSEFQGLSMILFAYYHGFISTADYLNVRTQCPHLQEFKASPNPFDLALTNPQCATATLSVITKVLLNRINLYNVYSDCAGTTEESVRELLEALQTSSSTRDNLNRHPIGNPLTMCLNATQLDVFFNREDVRTALHTDAKIDTWYGDALTTSSLAMAAPLLGVDGSQFVNASVLNYTGTLKGHVTPLWRELLANGIDGVIYHGDADMICDHISGLWAVESLQLPRMQKRAAWYVEMDGKEQQTGGFVETFKGMTYVTVKGAGHLVPLWKPVEAKRMLDLFVLEREG